MLAIYGGGIWANSGAIRSEEEEAVCADRRGG